MRDIVAAIEFDAVQIEDLGTDIPHEASWYRGVRDQVESAAVPFRRPKQLNNRLGNPVHTDKVPILLAGERQTQR